MSNRRPGFLFTLAALGLAAFSIRAYQPLTHADEWLPRSEKFTAALHRKEWKRTYQKYHPGLTTMALGGLALRARDAVAGSKAAVLFSWAVHPRSTDFGSRLAAGVLGIALAEAAVIVLIALALRRLGDPVVGLAAAGLLAFSPPVLAENRVFHPDGLAGLLMALSAVLLLRALRDRALRLVALSGFVAGLAFLTKTPSLFLVPFTALSLGCCALGDLRRAWSGPAQGRWHRLRGRIWRTVAGPGLVWVAAAALPFALWPAMWVKPAAVLKGLAHGASIGAFSPHEKMVFFAGQTYHGRAPLLFYPTEIVFRASFVTLTLAVAALGQYSLWRRRFLLPVVPAAFWLLVAYGGCFVVQMALSAKQTGTRYVYPAQVGVEVLAAVGLAGLAATIRERFSRGACGLGRFVVAAGAAAAIALQALIALPYAPDYGAHHDPLLGGNPMARRLMPLADGNEGIMAISDYLNGLPQPATLRVATLTRTAKSLRQYFSGTVIEGMPAEADYYLFDLGSQQRLHKTEQWQAAWEDFRRRRPDAVVMIDRVVFLWLYGTRKESAQTAVIRRGWEGMGPAPWLWTVALGAVIVWVLRGGSGFRARPQEGCAGERPGTGDP